MYEFEGVDYTKEPSAADKKAFEDLLSSKWTDRGYFFYVTETSYIMMHFSELWEIRVRIFIPGWNTDTIISFLIQF
jgi:hypothetical protein